LLLVVARQAHSQDYAFPDDALPPQVMTVKQPPRMLIEWGDKFYGTGELPFGVSPWKGTYWQPALWVFGTTTSTALMQTNTATEGLQTAQQRNRLDLFANLRLSGTERILVGFRPIDQGGYTGINLQENGGFVHADLQWKPAVYFFEGDIAELFQFLDYEDRRPRDIGFTVGRQALNLQEGLVMNDITDLVGITFNGLHLRNASNLRVSLIWAWNEVNALGTKDAHLYGLSTEADFFRATYALDVMVVDGYKDGERAIVAGASRSGWHGFWNVATRVAISQALTGDSWSSGAILFNEASRKVYPGQRIVFANSFIAKGAYTPAATSVPGPLGRLGILYGGLPVGGYTPGFLAPAAANEAGIALGHQWMRIPQRQQLVLEIGYRQGLFNGADHQRLGVALRAQQAFGQRFLLQVDAFSAHQFGTDGIRIGSAFGIITKL
jgi:hypothetical protein